MRERPRRLTGPEIDRLGREAFINLFLASSCFTAQVEQLCREEGMAMSHYVVLWFLARRHAPDGVPMGAVADGHLNRASDATRLADRLIHLGYLEPDRGPRPARRSAAMTPGGREVFVRLTRKVKAAASRAVESLERWRGRRAVGAARQGVVGRGRGAGDAPSSGRGRVARRTGAAKPARRGRKR